MVLVLHLMFGSSVAQPDMRPVVIPRRPTSSTRHPPGTPGELRGTLTLDPRDPAAGVGPRGSDGGRSGLFKKGERQEHTRVNIRLCE